SAALGVPFSTLLGEERSDRLHVLRRADQRVIASQDGGMQSRPLTGGGTLPGAEMYELVLQPQAISRSEPHAAGTRELLIVLVGHVRLSVLEEKCDLAPGDAVVFAADVP